MSLSITSAGTYAHATARRVAWPVERWPALDQQAWIRAQQGGDFLNDDGAAAIWRDATRRSAVGAYGRWLAFLQDHGCLDPRQGPQDRMNPDSLKAYVSFLQDSQCASKTIASYVGVLSMMIQAMIPGEPWRWLKDLQARLQRRSKPSRNKRSRIVPVTELMALGQDLMARAENRGGAAPKDAALDFRDGLMIALLAYRPLRQRNFVGIEIGRHLVFDGTNYTLCFPAEEMKNGRPLEFPYPEALLGVLRRYLDHYRPILLGLRRTRGASRQNQLPEANTRLWITQYGTAVGASAQTKALKKHTIAHFGHRLNPHLFRDCAATYIAIKDPKHVRISAQILAHSSLKSTERYYILANGMEATRGYHELVLSLRGKRR